MRRLLRLSIATVVAFAAAGTGSAQACSIAVENPPPTAAEVVEGVDLAIYGQVVSIRALSEAPGSSFEAKIRIQRVYRGKTGSALRVRYTTDEGLCGITLTDGRRIGLLLDRPGPPFRIGLGSTVTRAFLDRATDGRYHRPNRRR